MLYDIEKNNAKLFDEPDVLLTYCCPACLYLGHKRDFYYALKSGKMSKRFHCPDCGCKFMQLTLTHKVANIKELGRCVYDWACFGSFDSIKWDTIKARLKQRGWSEAFWHGFKEAKFEHHCETGNVT